MKTTMDFFFCTKKAHEGLPLQKDLTYSIIYQRCLNCI